MNGTNDDRQPQSGRSIREIISDATDRELKDFATGSLTPDELVAMAAAEERRRKRRMRRISGIAALFVIVLACGAFFVFSTFTTDVEADKNPKEEIVTEDGVIIEDGGWGSSSEDGWVITDWAEIQSIKKIMPEMIVPQFIPQDCKFEQLTIKEDGNATRVEFLFKDENGQEIVLQQYIHEENLEITNLYNESRSMMCSKGAIYLTENPNGNTATMQLGDGCIIELWSSFSDEDIVKIFENLSN